MAPRDSTFAAGARATEDREVAECDRHWLE
jgi:hypothetical protein